MRKGEKNQFFRAPRTARSADSGTAHGQIAVQEIFLRRYGIARSACADAGLDGAGVGSPMQASSHRPLTRAERRAAADRTCVHTTSRPHAAPSNTTDPCLRSGGEVADRRGIPSPNSTYGWIPSHGGAASVWARGLANSQGAPSFPCGTRRCVAAFRACGAALSSRWRRHSRHAENVSNAERPRRARQRATRARECPALRSKPAAR